MNATKEARQIELSPKAEESRQRMSVIGPILAEVPWSTANSDS